MAERNAIVERLLDRHGRTFCAELGVAIGKNTPAPLFQWLVAADLYSTRIGNRLAEAGAKALFDAGLTTPDKLAEAGWERRVKLLNAAGFARMDESYARMIGEAAELLIEKYHGDLRELREAAGRDPKQEIRLLQEFKGIGEAGAAIFCREVQAVWEELHPFADRKALEAAKALGLGSSAEDLAKLVDRADFPRLVAALVRCSLAGDADEIRAA
ncbi:hypothetical protein DDZ18_07200 [Marinicauda salina]|uniref:Endonuclease n=1 Tax=Marinicauda salina TaxID=2135793 RepID=A0A2U2BTY6_9PROT|nr:hypothetical protein [Marinicauda salina]PWE17459.1 hypothetical protein DDZ18_07200 [Marinicauda salina]